MNPSTAASSRATAAVRLMATVAAAALLAVGCGRSAPEGAAPTTSTRADDANGETAPADAELSAGAEQPQMAGARVVSEQPVVSAVASDQTTTTPTTFSVPATEIYVVQSGDAISLIAERFGVTINDLRRANPDLADINAIKPGQELIIPTAG